MDPIQSILGAGKIPLPRPRPEGAPRAEPSPLDQILKAQPAPEQPDPFKQIMAPPPTVQQEAAAIPEAPAEPSPDKDVGFLPLMGQAFSAGWEEEKRKDLLFWEGLKAKMTGGQFFPQEAPPEVPPPPAVKEQLDKPLSFDTAFSPKWWGTHLAHGMASNVVPTAAGMAGTMIGRSAAAGALPFGLVQGGRELSSRYLTAKKEGLSDDDAASRAIKESALAGTFGAASWAAFGLPLFGTTPIKNEAAEVIGQAFKRPFLEAAAQIGLVQPNLSMIERAGERLIQGKDMPPGEVLTNWFTDMGMGGLQLGAFHLASVGGQKAAQVAERTFVNKVLRPSEEEIRSIFEDVIKGGPVDKVPPYTRLSESIEAFEGEKQSASAWMHEFSSKVPEHELTGLLPSWAIDKGGNVSKADVAEAVKSKFMDVDMVTTPQGEELWLHEPTVDGGIGPAKASIVYNKVKDNAGRDAASIDSWLSANSYEPAVAFKMLEHFADKGFLRVMFPPDAPMADALRKAADRIGLDSGNMKYPGPSAKPDRVYIDLDARATGAQLGVPVAARPVTAPKITVTEPPSYRKGKYTPGELRPAGRRIVAEIEKWAKRFGLKRAIDIKLEEGEIPGFPHAWGLHSYEANKSDIQVSLKFNQDATAIWNTLAHEFGHAMFYEAWDRLPSTVKSLLTSQFGQRASGHATEKTLEKGFFESLPPDLQMAMKKDRKTFVETMQKLRAGGADVMAGNIVRLPSGHAFEEGFSPPGYKLANVSNWLYWLDFNEWIANNVAKWATSDQRPLNKIDESFSALGKQIRQVHEWANQKAGNLGTFDPAGSVKSWLDDLLTHGDGGFTLQRIMTQGELDGMAANRAAMIAEGGSGNGAVPPGASTIGGRNIAGAVGPTANGPAYAAHADKMNKFYEWMMNLRQITLNNTHIRGLVMYNELVNIRDLLIKDTQSRGFSRMKEWNKLGTEQSDALGELINHYMLQLYRTPKEVKQGRNRKPTDPEFQQMVQKYGVGTEALKVFRNIQDDFNYVLDRVKTWEINNIAAKIDEPVKQAQVLDNIETKYKLMKDQPYFPRMRFGEFTLTVHNAQGAKIRFETFKTERDRERYLEEFAKTALPGETATKGKMAKDAEHFFGLPPGLLDAMAEKLSLSDSQKAALQDLRLDYSPANSFAHRFQRLERIPGWSLDFRRAYASYMFSFSRWMANLEVAPSMRRMIDEVEKSEWQIPPDPAHSYPGLPIAEATQRKEIRNFMSEHFKQLMDPSQDISILRAALFHWYLGLSPIKALVNGFQIPMATYPFLAGHFGDLKSGAAIAKAGTDLRNFYKRGSYDGQTAFKMRAAAEAIREGWIDEGQANQFGALTNYDNLSHNWRKGATNAVAKTVLEASSWMFDSVEKFNRRVTFHAALDLALQNPDAKFVRQSIELFPLQYQRLLDRGFDPSEAAALTTARNAVEGTQFIYAPYARPKFMWGKKGTLFAFKSYTQNMLFMMGHYPGVRIRSLLMLGALGGLMGLPGMEDVSGLIKGLAWKIFGKDFDPDDLARKFARDILNGTIDPDTMLHGMSRHGFGIPQMMDMMGINMKGAYSDDPSKVWRGGDLSASLGMGRVLPVDFGALLRPTKDRSGPMVDAMQQALGPGFGFGAALTKSLIASQYGPTEFKRWEGIMPSAIRDASHAMRYYREGMEKNAQGQPVLRFDPTEPLHMAEIIGQAMGYRPARLTEQYDAMRADTEARAFWQISQQVKLNQLWQTIRTKDSAERARVMGAIKEWNQSLPPEAKPYTITSEMIEKSITARSTAAAKSAVGLPQATRDIPLSREIRSLHPGASIVGREKVR